MSFNEPIIYVRDANISQNQHSGILEAKQIDNYLKQIDELISKIEIRNEINARQDSRKHSNYNMKNIQLTTLSGIKKMNDDISQLESIIKNLPKKTQFRTISENEKKSQLGRLGILKSIFLQKSILLQQHLLFSYCIFSSGNKLIIMHSGNYVTDFTKYTTINNIQIFKNLIDIPQLFGEFRRIKNLCTEILEERLKQ